jgi:hypothetical protein
MLVVNLLWYPIARRLPAENRFLEVLTFWRWVFYSITVTVATLIVYTLIRALGLFGDG